MTLASDAMTSVDGDGAEQGDAAVADRLLSDDTPAEEAEGAASSQAGAETNGAEPKAQTKTPRRTAKRTGRRKATKANKVKAGNGQRRTRGTRPFPANSFEDALLLAESIQKFGGGQPIRRLTLFHE